MITVFRDGLRSHRELINRLNVYPVPDGDTGTNMALTMESVTDELAGLDSPDLDATCRAIAHGSLMGARGNSGVILSQLLRGLSEGLNCSSSRPGPVELSEALTIADKLAREAVMRPVEGTILTVARGAAEGASSAAEAGRPLVEVVEASRAAAADALARTPSLLPVLEQAGVVDAGRHRLPPPARRPADRGGRAGHATAARAARHRVRSLQPRGPGHGVSRSRTI